MHEPVAAGERLEEAGDLAQARGCRAARAPPAAVRRSSPRCVPRARRRRASVRSSPITRLRNSRASAGENRRSAARTSVSWPRLRSRASGQRWIGPGRDHQAQRVGKVVEQEGHRLVHLGCLDGVVVVEHQEPLRPWRLLAGAGDVVDERGQRGGHRRGAHRLDDRGVDVEADALQGCHQVRHEPRQVVVTVVQGEPRDAGVGPVSFQLGEPVAEQRGLAEPCRCGHQSRAGDRGRGVVSSRAARAGPRDQQRATRRREQLGERAPGSTHPDHRRG